MKFFKDHLRQNKNKKNPRPETMSPEEREKKVPGVDGFSPDGVFQISVNVFY
jgi:hypothetical protein